MIFLLFVAMTVGRGRHALLRIHEFFTILRFLREIDQHQAELLQVAQAESVTSHRGFGGKVQPWAW